MARNDVYLNINSLSPADAVVTGQQDMTAATIPELVLGDTPTFNFYFTDNTNVWPSWAGNAAYTLTWALSDAVAGDFAPAATTGNATPITGGWSVVLPLNSYDLVGLLNTKRVGQPYPVQNLWQQLRVTDPSGNEITRAMVWTPVRYRAISDTQNTESASPTGGRFVTVNNVNELTTPTDAQFYAANPVPTSALGTASNGQLFIGNGTGFTKATLTAGTGVAITNGSGSITIDATNAQELLTATVTNAEATPITKGQVVYIFGATGNRPSVKLAYNTSDATSAKTFGVVSDSSISAGGTGTVTCVGVVDGLNLGAYQDGDTLYLGATPGSVTATKPYAPNHLVYVGIVERANAGNGELYVRVQNGYELDEIHDVQINAPKLAGQTLIYDQTNDLWKNARLTGTANQITVTNADAAVTLSIPTNPTLPGNLTVSGTGTSTFGGNLTVSGTGVSTLGASGARVLVNGATDDSSTNLQVSGNASLGTISVQAGPTTYAAYKMSFTAQAADEAFLVKFGTYKVLTGEGYDTPEVTKLYSNNTLALTLSSTQAATLAGNLTVSGGLLTLNNATESYVELKIAGTAKGYLDQLPSTLNILGMSGVDVDIYAGGNNPANRVAKFAASGIATTLYGNLTVSGKGDFQKSLTTITTESDYAVRIIPSSNDGGLYLGANSTISVIQAIDPNTTWDRNISVQPNGGKFLIGTTIDGGQKLQVNGDAAFAGDRVINRKDQNAVTRLQVRNDTSGTSGQAQIAATVGDFTTYTALGQLSAGFTSTGLYQANSGYLVGSNALYIFTASGSSLVLGTNNTTALTLSGSDQSATFAGQVTVNSTTDATNKDTGSLVLEGGLGVEKNIIAGLGISARGALTLPATWSGQYGLGFEYGAAVSRVFFGDGTGYTLKFVSRASSTTTDRMTLTDSGNLTVSGTGAQSFSGYLNVTGSTTADGLSGVGSIIGGTKRVYVGFDTGNDRGFIQAVESGVSGKELRLQPLGSATVVGGALTVGSNITVSGTQNVLGVPASANALATNSTMTFELTSNTELKIKVRGTDGTTRSVSLTLA